eukprot:337456_1
MPINPQHWWNIYGVPQFNLQHEQRKWRIKRQNWRDRFEILNEYGEPDMENVDFLNFLEKYRVSDDEMPVAARVITPDRAQHLALTFNQFMYRSTIQKRAQLEDAIYWGFVETLRQTLNQCMCKEGGEAYRFCRPFQKAYFDALAPVTNIKWLWDEKDIENAKKRRLQMYSRWVKNKKLLYEKHGVMIDLEDINPTIPKHLARFGAYGQITPKHDEISGKDTPYPIIDAFVPPK